jgi:hypothetical protein
VNGPAGFRDSHTINRKVFTHLLRLTRNGLRVDYSSEVANHSTSPPNEGQWAQNVDSVSREPTSETSQDLAPGSRRPDAHSRWLRPTNNGSFVDSLCRALRYLRCVMREDEVASLGLIVAGETGFHGCRGRGFAVYESSEPPAARRGVLGGVFDHKLNVRGGARDERLGLAKDLVVFRRRDVTIVQSSNDRAVRVWKLALAVGLDRHIVAQNGANLGIRGELL